MTAARRGNRQRAMSIGAHLRELRKRLALALVGIVAAMVVGWFLYPQVMELIQRPLTRLSGANPQLNFQTIVAAFELQLRVAFGLGLIIASPWWLYQIGAFIGPGLKRGEKIHAVAFGAVGALLFSSGAAAGVLVVPRAVSALTSFVPEGAATLVSADSYVSFTMYVVLAFALSFLLPELLVALNFLGLLSARAMLRGWRWAVVACFTFAAIINPLPSPVPMILQALGMLALYLLAVGIAALHERRRRRATDKADPAETTEQSAAPADPTRDEVPEYQ